MVKFRIFLVLFVGLGMALPIYAEPLNSSNRLADTASFQYALENNRSGTATAWRNPDTAAGGSTVPVRTYQTATGTYCREFQQTIIIDGRQERGYGTACRQPDGHWLIVNPNSLGQANRQPAKVVKKVRVYDRPDYYAYPPRYAYPYFPGYLSLSFGYVKHKGHSHYRNRHHRGHHNKLHYGKSRHYRHGKAHHRFGKQKGHSGRGYRHR